MTDLCPEYRITLSTVRCSVDTTENPVPSIVGLSNRVANETYDPVRLVRSEMDSNFSSSKSFADGKHTLRRPLLPDLPGVLLLEKLSGSTRRSSHSALSLHGDRNGFGLQRKPLTVILERTSPGTNGNPNKVSH